VIPLAAAATSIHVAVWQVAASLALVALAAAISFWQKADLERDILVATGRSIVQLTLVGYAIKLIFEADNAMTASAVALNRLGDEMGDARARIEATLALGATAREAAAPTIRRSLRSGMIALVDSTKTTGLIFFPGTMVGMLLAGASPTDAVRLQLILLYTLLGSVSISALTATLLAYRNFFTPATQLRDPGS
jgi:ABC-type iron transport system FetAB permease component